MTTRTAVAPAHTRPGPGPAGGTTLHAIGDTHTGLASSLPFWRGDALVRDALLERMPAPAAVVQLGDNVNNNPDQDTVLFQHLMDRLGTPWHHVMGNHDIHQDVQTPAQWAARFGLPQPCYSVDLPTLRLVMFSPSEQWSNNQVVSPAKLAWLDAQLAGTSLPVFVCCHWPIHDTVSGIAGFDARSTEETVYIRTAATASSADILDVLAAHDNFKAWISGHTHSRIEVPGLVLGMVHAGHKFAAINTSSIWFTGNAPGRADDTINTLYITWLDDQLEVRPRNHGGGVWAAPNGNRLFRVTGLG
jgi:hypothetical protein